MIYEPLVNQRLPEQFKKSININEFIKAFLDRDLEISEDDLLNDRWVDTAVGTQLDGIGDIVGIKRPRGAETDDGDFGFDLDDTARGFGDATSEANGGFLGSITPAFLLPIDDDSYRIIIKAKIAINNSDMSVDSMLDILSSIFSAKVTYYLEDKLTPLYEINKTFTAFETKLLSEFPNTLGVKNTLFSTHPTDIGFGFDGDSSALTFGDDVNPANGGYLSNLIVT